MKKLYYKFLVLIFVASGIAGCKLDPPIYPANGTTAGNGGGGNTTTPGGGTTNPGGGNNNPGGGDQGDVTGLPITAANNITIKINGTTYTYTQYANFVVAKGGSSEAQQANAPNGYTYIQASGSSIIDIAGISFNNSTTGTFDIDIIQAGHFTKTSSETGKVKITVLTSNNIQGIFNVDITDVNDNTEYKNCPGSFNIKQ